MSLNSGKKQSIHLKKASYNRGIPKRSIYPSMRELLENPESKTLIGFEKCPRYQKWKSNHDPNRSVMVSKTPLKSTRESSFYRSTFQSRRRSSNGPPAQRRM
mmetsp:Transcript_22432/g.22228  ORF Transcript_22432/g.22228 Transcript_22432/m.22228 type:complete len:102 (-) Transcript_22432:20-325(-)